MEQTRLILASASPRREELLGRLRVPFVVRPCELAEPTERPAGVSPTSWAEALAYFKASGVPRESEDTWALGADTVVACEGELLGKPADEDDARRMLNLQAGRRSDVITGIALVGHGEYPERIIRHSSTAVWMRDDPEEIETYLAGGDWAGKAGAYGIQNVGDRLVERIEGSFTNVVGLPLKLIEQLLRAIRLLPCTRERTDLSRTP